MISTFSLTISLRSSNFFLIEFIFKYERVILLWLWILRDVSPSKEFIGCSWIFGHILGKGSDVHKAFTNFLKLLARKDEPRLFRWSLPLFKHDLSILLLSIKVQNRWSLSLMLWISEYRKIWTRNNSVFGHFLRSVSCQDPRYASDFLLLLIYQ